MGFDNQLFYYMRDGQHEGMAITILGSRRSLQLKNQKPIQYVTIHETSQQTERGCMKIDREVATRDRDRERLGRRYSRDLDVRYMSSWKNLKEKLLSAYSCNQQQCPMIKERFIQHNQSIHGGRRCETKCTLASSKSKTCVSIRAGPDFDQYSDQKCSDCPMPYTSSNHSKYSSCNRNGKYHDSCTKPAKGNLKNDKKYASGCTSPFNNTLKIKSEYGTAKNSFDEYVDTSSNKNLMSTNRNNANDCCDGLKKDKYTRNIKNSYEATANDKFEKYTDAKSSNNNVISKNSNDVANGCCNLEPPEYSGNNNANVFMRPEKYVDGYTTPDILMNKTSNNDAHGCCDISEKPGYTDNSIGYDRSFRNACADPNDTHAYTNATRYVEGCTSPSNNNFRNDSNNVNDCCDTLQLPGCTDNYATTYSSSYIGNIEAPKFPIIRTSKNRDENCKPGTSKSGNDTQFINKSDRLTNTPTMIDTGNTCSMQNDKFTPSKKLYTVDESTGGDSIMSSLMSIVKNRGNSKTKSPKTFNHLPNRGNVDNSTSHPYKLIPPYDIDKSSNSKSDSKLSLRNNGLKYRRNSNSNPIYKEVKDWIREVPMYPGLEKEAKDKNNAIIDELVKKLYKLSREAGSPEYHEKVSNEIETCLNKIPLWYPGPKREQSGFKRSLVDDLTQRLKNLNRKNSGTHYSKQKPHKSLVTEVRTSLTSCNQSFINQYQSDPKNVEVKICIIDWLQLIYSKTKNNNVLKKQIFLLADFITLRMNQLLNKAMSTSNQNIFLKTAILKIMNDLPIVIDCPINKDLNIQDLAEDLANRLLSIQAKYFNVCNHSIFPTGLKFSNKHSCHRQREIAMCSEIRKCLEGAKVDCNNMLIEKAGVVLNNCYDIPDPEGKRHARSEIMNLLVSSTNLSEAQAWNLAKVIIKDVRKFFYEREVCASSQTCSQLQKSFTTSVYTSIEDASSLTYFLTSTPKKKRVKKEIPKLNPQEIQYIDNVANLIRTWMNTLPVNFNAPEEAEFKETMIYDLAGDIMDEAKLDQLAPDPKKNKREVQRYIVCRWIFKVGAFEFQDVDEKIDFFLNKLQEIPVPTMTQPQHGNRQAMENIKFYEGSKWVENFVPKGTDVLEDEISIWMHEQPSNIFNDNNKKFRQDKIHELAQVLENKSGKKRSQKEASKDISKWLNEIVRPDQKRGISELRDTLKDRIMNLPQDATLAGIVDNRSKIREEHRKSKMEIANLPKTYMNNNKNNESGDQENTMAIFISKFIEHHYDIDDPLARRAFNRLLNSHLLSLNLPTRKEVYDHFEKNEDIERFPSGKVIRELEYIKDISDWLKNIPIDPSYNTLGNRERIDFVNSLALSIREVEEDRENNPDAMDYDLYMSHIILEHLKLLPIPKEYNENVPFMIHQLFNKIIAHRKDVSDTIKANESIDTSGVNPNNIGDLIEEFIRINGNDIAHDEVKMEAWAIRLIREIKKIVPNTSRPSVLSKAHVYDKFTEVPIPTDETVKFFNLELDYVKEIANWMKNLPLLRMNDLEKDNLTTKICNLAEKIVEKDRKRLSNPNDKGIDTDFKEYVTKWIAELSLNKEHDIVFPVIIQQLMNRIEKIKQKGVSTEFNTCETTTNKNDKVRKNKSAIFKQSKKNKVPNSSYLTDAIEKWSHALPIRAENDDATTDMKNDISRKMFQEVGQLNMIPSVNNDDILYKDRLGDEIDNIFEKLPQNNEFQNKKENFKEDIVNTIVEIKNEIKDKAAGDTYKLDLEKKIDTSIPNPVPCYQVYDPGFEIYKDRLATAFILENFDHGADALKMKYETLLRKEIDKYFNHARNRNSIPLSKDQLYNELYSALFNVSIPNEASVIDEVEKVKTRCEIDAWFEELPLKEANDLNELLDWDKIMSTLASRVHEIETSESKPDNKIFKEIMKWLAKLPLQPGNENKVELFANTLQKRLKSTVNQRKCVLDNSKTKSKKDKSKTKTRTVFKKSKENSQIAGPSSSGKMWATLPQTHDTSEHRTVRKNAADDIYDIVHTWCNELPINADQEHAKKLKDDLTTKMTVKISELNANPEIFNDNVLYDKLLVEKLDRLLSTIPTACDFSNSKATRIHQLTEALKSVKPHIVEERASYKYKQDLINTVDKILDRPKNVCSNKEAYLDAIRNDIIDDFIQYKYSNDDSEDKQTHKINLQDNIPRYTTPDAKSNTNVNKKDPKYNPLFKANQLITELSKVLPKSNNIVKNEIEKIRLKKEIADFFNEIGVPSKDVSKLNYLKESLAIKLQDIEMNGYNPENENKMKQEILRRLKKVGKDKNPTVIDAFLTKLKQSEMARRMPQDIAKESTEFTEQECDRACYSKNQNFRNEHPHPSSQSTTYLRVPYYQTGNNKPANFAKRLVCPSQKHPRIYENKIDNAGTEYISNDGEEEMPLRDVEMISDQEESSSDDEDRRICLCKRKYGNRHKRRPYCMVPMRYFCEGRDVLNSLWCGMPLPLF